LAYRNSTRQETSEGKERGMKTEVGERGRKMGVEGQRKWERREGEIGGERKREMGSKGEGKGKEGGEDRNGSEREKGGEMGGE